MNRNTALILALLGGVGAFLFAARSRAGETPAGGNGGGSGDQGALPGADTPSLWEQWRDTPAAPYTPGFGPAPPGQPGGTAAPAQQPLEPTPAPEPVSTSQLAPYKWGDRTAAQMENAPYLVGSTINFAATPAYKKTTITGNRIFTIKPAPFRYKATITATRSTGGYAPLLKITKDQAGQIPVDAACSNQGTNVSMIRFTNVKEGAPYYVCTLQPGITYYAHVATKRGDPAQNTYYLTVSSGGRV